MSNQNNVNSGNNENTSKDVFSTWKQTSDKYFDAVEKVIPRYHQSVTSLQQEYIQACDNSIESTIDYQRKFANKTAKAFGELNNNVMQSWISAFTPTRN